MSDELHTVARFANPIEAALARNALEAAGIRAVVNDEYTLTTDPMLVGALNFIKVQVSAADRERAADVLAAESVPPAELTEAALAEAEPEAADAIDGDDEIPVEPEGERLVRYAFRAAVMGLLACPPLLHIYSLVLLIRVAIFHNELPPAANRRFYAALLLDLAVLATAALLMLDVFRSLANA
jgi:hypothetical protein